MANFIHQNYESADLKKEDTPQGRFYITPEGDRYPSVTTVLSKSRDQTGLKKWREAVGKEQANQILKQAQNRGNAVHLLAEEYIKNNPNWARGHMPSNLDSFKQFKILLDNNLNLVYGQELRLYSTLLQAAGTADLVCKWNGENAIVDFKTARKEKTEEFALGYLLQATAYSIMVEERFGLVCPYIVVLLARDHENIPQVFIKETADYCQRVTDIFKNYSLKTINNG